MHRLLTGTVGLAALIGTTPAFAQYYYGPGGFDEPPPPNYGYDYGPGYYDPGYPAPLASPPVYEGRSVAVGPDTGASDSIAYCQQRFRSYDPSSGTYLGFDGIRHPCP